MSMPTSLTAIASLTHFNIAYGCSIECAFGKETLPLQDSLTLLADYLAGLESLLDKALFPDATPEMRMNALEAGKNLVFWRAFIQGVADRAKVLEELADTAWARAALR